MWTDWSCFEQALTHYDLNYLCPSLPLPKVVIEKYAPYSIKLFMGKVKMEGSYSKVSFLFLQNLYWHMHIFFVRSASCKAYSTVYNILTKSLLALAISLLYDLTRANIVFLYEPGAEPASSSISSILVKI